MKNIVLALAILSCFSPLVGWAQSTSNANEPARICGSSINPDALRKSNPEKYQEYLLREERTQNFLETNHYVSGKTGVVQLRWTV